jgi:hypothetical protein
LLLVDVVVNSGLDQGKFNSCMVHADWKHRFIWDNFIFVEQKNGIELGDALKDQPAIIE